MTLLDDPPGFPADPPRVTRDRSQIVQGYRATAKHRIRRGVKALRVAEAQRREREGQRA